MSSRDSHHVPLNTENSLASLLAAFQISKYVKTAWESC